jgi:putative tricarboxylic transport membrane protein
MKKAGVWTGLILIIFAGTLFWKSLSLKYYSDYGPGPGFFPIWMSGLLIVLSILYIIDSLRKQGIHIRNIFPNSEGLRKVLSIFLSLIVFLVLVPFTGYTIASISMLCILFFREYKWYWGIGISVTISLVLFIAFHYLLKVSLPVNSLFNL